MKYVLILLTMVILVGCSAEQQANSNNLETEDLNLNDIENQEMEDQVIYDDEIKIEIVDNVVEVDVSEETIEYEVTQTLEEWCIPGEIFNQEVEGSSTESVMKGITTYKGIRVCESESVTITEAPYIGEIRTVTTYYLNEDISEMWALIESMGQVTETHVVLK